MGESAQFALLQNALFRKSVQLIQEYRDRLAQDQIGGRFVPEDGNVCNAMGGSFDKQFFLHFEGTSNKQWDYQFAQNISSTAEVVNSIDATRGMP